MTGEPERHLQEEELHGLEMGTEVETEEMKVTIQNLMQLLNVFMV